MNDSIRIGPRYVKQGASGLRPFQRQALEVIKGSGARLIFVEAPVGAGKSYIGRWPDRDFISGEANLILYNSESLVRAVRALKLDPRDGRGNLLRRLFFQLGAWAKRGAVVTSPDVLWESRIPISVKSNGDISVTSAVRTC